MEWLDYYNLLSLVHLILQLSFGIFILYKACQILKVRQILSKATPTMVLYFCFMATLSTTLIIYAIYAIVLWRSDVILHDQTTLYIFGFFPWILICINPVIEFCLCMERCLTILFPYQYLDKSKKLMSFFTFMLFIFCLIFNVWLNDLANFPQFKRPMCRFFTCFIVFMPKRYLTPFKILISSLEGLAAIFLLFLIKYKTLPSIYSKNKSRNKAILIIIFTTIIFEFAPNLADEACALIFDDTHLVTYIGPYRTTISGINIIISILMYSKVFNKGTKETSTVHISPTMISARTMSSNLFKEKAQFVKILSK